MNEQELRITVLVDNQARAGMSVEHGLALWIETEGKRILFDTGQGCALTANSRELGIDLSETDVMVLSHGHYDHTGGIPQILKSALKVETCCHSDIFQHRYSIRDGEPKPIHMPYESWAAICNLPSQRVHWVSQPFALSGKIGVAGSIPRETDYEDAGGPFFLDLERRIPDAFDDEMALWIRTEHGLVVCVGCCHAGLVNTLNHVQRLNDNMAIRAVIGGFHLLSASAERLSQTMDALSVLHLERVIACHCTGKWAAAQLSSGLGERLSPGAAGMSYEFS